MRRRTRRDRRGYAMVMVCTFLVLMVSLLGAAREVTTTLQVEMARSRRVNSDQGSMVAAAQALSYLENTASKNIVSPQTFNNSYTVTFTPLGNNQWTVVVAFTPGTN